MQGWEQTEVAPDLERDLQRMGMIRLGLIVGLVGACGFVVVVGVGQESGLLTCVRLGFLLFLGGSAIALAAARDRLWRQRLIEEQRNTVRLVTTTLAHHINNPLAVIYGLTELRLSDTADEQARADYLAIIEQVQRGRQAMRLLAELEHLPLDTSVANMPIIDLERISTP